MYIVFCYLKIKHIYIYLVHPDPNNLQGQNQYLVFSDTCRHTSGIPGKPRVFLIQSLSMALTWSEKVLMYETSKIKHKSHVVWRLITNIQEWM